MAFPTTVDALSDGSSIGHASQVLGPQRITVGPTMYNVLSDQYGPADPTGATDSTAAIAAAETAAAATGGIVVFPPGTYLAAGLNLDSNVHWMGSGEGATTLKLKGSSNTFLVQSAGFAALTGTNSTAGATNCSINQMSLDGNKASNGSSTVPVVRLYGYGFRLRDLRLKNGNNEGLYSEWSTSLPSPGADSMMAFVDNLKVHDCGSHGVHWNGPHDSQWAKGEVFNNGGRGIWADTNGSGLILMGVHSWGLTQTYAAYFGTTGCGASACTFEGATTAQLALDGNDCWASGGFVYGAGAVAPVGIVFGSGGARQDIAVTGIKIDNCTSGALAFTNDGGALIVADIFQSGGTLTTGTISINTRMTLRTNGVAGSVDRLPGGLELHGGSTLRLYSSADGGFATLAFDGSQVTNSWPFQGAAGQFVAAGAGIRPGTAAGAIQAGNLFMGSGAPSNANGNNGDFYFRTDTPGTANQRLYTRSAGAWTGIV